MTLSYKRPSRRKPKPQPRPKMQIATLAATLLLLALFSLLTHANTALSQNTLLDSLQPADEHMRPTHIRQSQTHTILFSADGSRFQIGPTPFSILPLNDTVHLPVHDLLHSEPFSPHRQVNIAFFLQISLESFPLLPRLLVVLWHPKNLYVIHLDTKIPDEKADAFANSLRRIPSFSNVHLLDREPITYKGVSMLLNTLSAIEYLLSIQQPWDYFINLSGSDYPLVNTASMRHILASPQIVDRKQSFIQLSTSKAFWDRMRHSRFDYIFYDTALGMKDMPHKLLNTWLRHPVKDDIGIQFLQAEAWIIAHRSFAQFAARSPFARKLLILLSAMQDPEEHFFPMLAWNNKQFNASLAHHAFRGIFWDFNGTMSGQHPYFVDEVSETAASTSERYKFWERYLTSCQCFFARKFRVVNSDLMERIDKQLSGSHVEADKGSVNKALKSVQKYVACISETRVDGEIRSYNVCR